MHPVLFNIGKMTLYTYGLFVGLGFMAAIWFAGKKAKHNNISPDDVTDLFFTILLSSLIGARILYVLLNFPVFIEDPISIFKIWNGGLVFYGGFICALISGFIFVKKKKLALWQTADILAPAIALGHAVGRIGCLFAGCCYGAQCDLPWAITFKNTDSLAPLGVPLHPTQVYSVISNLLIFGILVWLDKHKKFQGMIFWSYILLYGLFRSFIEIFRGDVRGHFIVEFFSVSQGIGLLMAFCGACMLFYLSRNKQDARA